jgi:hypothetical protein
MRSQWTVALITISVALGGGMIAGSARADDRMCVREAREVQEECRAECRDEFLMERDLCRNIDPACGETCRTGYLQCKASFDTVLASCVDGCQSNLIAERSACPPAGSPGRAACIDQAQVRAFVCRDTCRENRDVREGRRQCRRLRGLCARACPPPDAGGPPDPGLG